MSAADSSVVSVPAVTPVRGWADFRRFWLGESISLLGSHVTTLALPFVAITTLNASPAALGAVNAAGFAPFLVLTLFAGVVVDRFRRRPVLIWANVVRGVALCAVPALAHAGILTLGQLCLVAVVAGAATVFFELAMHSYVPDLVDPARLVTANSWLYGSVSVAQVGGPAVAGILVDSVGAPTAILVDAASFAVSVALLLSIRTVEPRPDRVGTTRVLDSIRTGLAFLARHRHLRPCAVYAGAYNLCWMALQTAFLLYAVRELRMAAGVVGAVLAVAALGSVAGSVLARRLGTRFGVGPTVVAATAVACLSPALLPVVPPDGPRAALLTGLVVAFLVGDLGSAVANIHMATLRQELTPPGLLGRLNASYRLIAWGALPVGALTGGALVAATGGRATLVVTAVGFSVALLTVVLSPLRSLRVVSTGG